MSRSSTRNKKRVPKATPSLPVIHPHAAGIDVGATAMYVSLPIDSCDKPIAQFGCFTEDLHLLRAALKESAIETVAMESTGVYWIPLFEILEQAGLEVLLVNPNYPKKPYKSDVEDCQWLQYLHSVGLLKGSFRPDQQVCAVRAILRHRTRLVSQSSSHIQRMQKSLTQMNLLLHNVISDITGTTGLYIIDAILNGERDAHVLASLADYRIKATPEEIAKSLVGNYRDEHLFTLKQEREAYAFCRKQMRDCDSKIERMLKDFDNDAPDNIDGPAKPAPSRPVKNEIVMADSDLRDEMHRIMGVDLTTIPGIGTLSAHTIFCEVGPDLSKFPSANHFTSWLRLCPNNQISGGKVLKKGAPRASSPLAVLLRKVSQGLYRSQTYIGDFFRRIRARYGGASAVTATAHKLATIIYTMLTTKQPYDEGKFESAKTSLAEKRLKKLHKDAASQGYMMVPIPTKERQLLSIT